MKRQLLPLMAAAALALGGCAVVGPDYQRPAVALPAAYAQASTDSTELSGDWWTLYGDPALDRLVAQALARNSDIAQAVARVEQADAALREAGGAALPTINGGANASRSRVSGLSRNNPSGVASTRNDLSLTVSTAFEIDFWGKLKRTTEAARAQALASGAARDTVRLTVAGALVQGWFTLQALDEQRAATRQTLQTREEGLRLVRARLQAGTVSRLDAEQADILRADAALQLRELERQRAVTVSQLGLLSGEPGLTVPESRLRIGALPALPPAGLPSALLERRPDVRRAEQQLVAANAQIGIARAAMFPTLTLNSSLGGQSTALSSLLDGAARFWSLGFGLSLPLFDGGRNAARVDQAGAAQREAVAAYQGAVATAFKEVADALSNLQAARVSEADLTLRAAASTRALALAKARFDAGYTGSLEYLDAQRTATASQLDVVRNRQAQLTASVELIKALGGGWQGL